MLFFIHNFSSFFCESMLALAPPVRWAGSRTTVSSVFFRYCLYALSNFPLVWSGINYQPSARLGSEAFNYINNLRNITLGGSGVRQRYQRDQTERRFIIQRKHLCALHKQLSGMDNLIGKTLDNLYSERCYCYY